MNWVLALIQSGAGAIIGFVLAQSFSLASWLYIRQQRPKLIIEADEPRLLSHSTAVESGTWYAEEIYGFTVRNEGKCLATGVRFQLLKIECRAKPTQPFHTVSEHVFDLTLHTTSSKHQVYQTVLVPGAAATIHLASWREDYWAVMPAIRGVPDYYEESCADATEYRFTVVAFDDKANFASQAVMIDLRRGKRKAESNERLDEPDRAPPPSLG